MAVDKFFSLGVLTFTIHHKQLCAVCYVLYPPHRNGKNFRVLQHPQAPTCLRPWAQQHQSPVGVAPSNVSLQCGIWVWFLASGMGAVLHYGDPMLCWAFADQTRPWNYNSGVRSHNMDQPTLFATSTMRGAFSLHLTRRYSLFILVMAAIICVTSLHSLRIWPVN